MLGIEESLFSLFLKQLILGAVTVSVLRLFQYVITLVVKKRFLMLGCLLTEYLYGCPLVPDVIGVSILVFLQILQWLSVSRIILLCA